MTSPDRPPPPIARTLHISDAISAWSDAGFFVADASVRLGDLTLRLEQPNSTPTLGFNRPLSAQSAVDGTPRGPELPWTVAAEESVSAGPATGTHPNGISDIDHIVLMAPDQLSLRRTLNDAGLEIRRERPASIAGSDVIQFFVWAGPVLLEIVAPAKTPSPASLASPASPISIWGIAAISDDIESTVEWFGENSSPARPAVQTGRSIATLRNRALGLGLTVAVMTRRPPK